MPIRKFTANFDHLVQVGDVITCHVNKVADRHFLFQVSEINASGIQLREKKWGALGMEQSLEPIHREYITVVTRNDDIIWSRHA